MNYDFSRVIYIKTDISWEMLLTKSVLGGGRLGMCGWLGEKWRRRVEL